MEPETINWRKLTVWLESAPGSNTYVHPCALLTQELEFEKTLNEVTVPDCDDATAPVWLQRFVRHMSAGLSTDGALAAESMATWRSFFEDQEPRNVKITVDNATAGGFYLGKMHLSRFRFTGNESDGVLMNAMELASHGRMTWHDAT